MSAGAIEVSKEIIVKHYNSISTPIRPLQNLRKLNNWVKAVLIELYTPEGGKVLDLAAGKGGDIAKWLRRSPQRVVMIDIAEKAIHEAKARYDKMKCRIPFLFISADYSMPVMYDSFDIVSCQFALHYAFESEATLRGVLKNVKDNLKLGGYFIATIPNGSWIYDNIDKGYTRDLGAFGSIKGFGNPLFNIELIKPEKLEIFGSVYNFHLQGNIDCPEYLVHFPTLLEIAREYGLRAVECLSFEQFEEKYMKKYMDLARQMGVKEALSKEEREIFKLYDTIVFKSY